MVPNSHITTIEHCERNRYCAEDGNNTVFPLPARQSKTHYHRFFHSLCRLQSNQSDSIKRHVDRHLNDKTLHRRKNREELQALFCRNTIRLVLCVVSCLSFSFVFLCHQLIPLNSMLQFIVIVLNV